MEPQASRVTSQTPFGIVAGAAWSDVIVEARVQHAVAALLGVAQAEVTRRVLEGATLWEQAAERGVGREALLDVIAQALRGAYVVGGIPVVASELQEDARRVADRRRRRRGGADRDRRSAREGAGPAGRGDGAGASETDGHLDVRA